MGPALAGVTARGSVTAFAQAVSDFLAKDVAAVRDVAGDLGVLGDAIGALGDTALT